MTCFKGLVFKMFVIEIHYLMPYPERALVTPKNYILVILALK